MVHLTYNNVDEFIEKQKHYSELSNKKKIWLKLMPTRVGHFLKLYFVKLGFLDGWHGYNISKIYAK